MGVAHPSPIPSFDVQSAAGAGCRSFVTAEIASLSATGKPGPSPSDRSAPALSEEATEVDRRRPVPLGLAVRSLGRLAVCPGDREAGDRDCLASQRPPAVLHLEGAAGQSRASSRTETHPRPDPPDEPREPALGCPRHPWRITQTRHRHRRDQRHQVHGAHSQTAVTNLANLPEQSRQKPGIGGLFHGSDGFRVD